MACRGRGRGHRLRGAAVGALLLAAALVAAACTHDVEQVLLPPRVDMQGIETIAVLPFDNYSLDPGLGVGLEDGITAALQRAYRVVDRGQVMAALAEEGLMPVHLTSPEIARRVGRRLGADAVVSGAATYYFEDVVVDAPHCVGCNQEGATPLWRTQHQTVVIVSLSARLIEVDSGNVRYTRTVDGENTQSETIHIRAWTDRQPGPEAYVPRPSRKDVPLARRRAIQRAVDLWTRDLLPTYTWVRRR